MFCLSMCGLPWNPYVTASAVNASANSTSTSLIAVSASSQSLVYLANLSAACLAFLDPAVVAQVEFERHVLKPGLIFMIFKGTYLKSVAFKLWVRIQLAPPHPVPNFAVKSVGERMIM